MHILALSDPSGFAEEAVKNVAKRGHKTRQGTGASAGAGGSVM
jgi:hypothetical protein